MGVQVDRILEPFKGPFERITEWNVKPPAGRIEAGHAAAYELTRASNDAVIAVNRMLKAGESVRVTERERAFQFGATPATFKRLQTLATELGISFRRSSTVSSAVPLRAPRIGLWDQYGGSMPSGWTRWILEQFEFPFTRVFARELDAGNLNAKYDVLVFVDGAIPAPGGLGERGGGRGQGSGDPADVPPEYRSQLGRITPENSIPQLRRFIEQGGNVVAIGDSAMNLAAYLDLPLENHLMENGAPVSRSKYFVPGSVLTARVDTTLPIAAGMRERTDFFFDNSPVFRLKPTARGVRAIAWFDNPTPLRSGWAWGQRYLDKGVIAVLADLGRGRVYLFGPEILHRAQPHGTFKLLFNALYRPE
jgi:hypothetical protein